MLKKITAGSQGASPDEKEDNLSTEDTDTPLLPLLLLHPSQQLTMYLFLQLPWDNQADQETILKDTEIVSTSLVDST